VIKYKNTDLDKLQILKENKGKSGIYRWTNLVNDKSCIGSSANLGRRLRNYFTISYLEYNIKKTRSSIYNALAEVWLF
jgi:excinuclease UvrABC nuclease subunit